MRKMLLLTLFCLLLVTGAAAAQDISTTFCGALSAGDCTVITQSASAMRDLKSAGFNFELNISAAGIPDSNSENIGFRMTGSGTYALGDSSLLFSPSALMQNIENLPQMFEDAIRAIAADANITMFFTEGLQQMMASGQQTRLPEKAGLSIRLLDGMAYLNLNKLTALLPDQNIPKGWFGFDLAAYYRQLLEQQGGVLGTTNPLSFTTPETLQKYISVERQDDTMLDGQNMAVFKTSLDLAGLFSSTEYRDYMTSILTQSGSNVSKSQLEQVMTAMQSMFGGLAFESTQTIGQGDYYTHRLTVSVDWPFDVSALSGAFGGSSSAQIPPISIQVALQANLNQFNTAPAIAAPVDAIIIPADQINQLTQNFITLPTQ